MVWFDEAKVLLVSPTSELEFNLELLGRKFNSPPVLLFNGVESVQVQGLILPPGRRWPGWIQRSQLRGPSRAETRESHPFEMENVRLEPFFISADPDFYMQDFLLQKRCHPFPSSNRELTAQLSEEITPSIRAPNLPLVVYHFFPDKTLSTT